MGLFSSSKSSTKSATVGQTNDPTLGGGSGTSVQLGNLQGSSLNINLTQDGLTGGVVESILAASNISSAQVQKALIDQTGSGVAATTDVALVAAGGQTPTTRLIAQLALPAALLVGVYFMSR